MKWCFGWNKERKIERTNERTIEQDKVGKFCLSHQLFDGLPLSGEKEENLQDNSMRKNIKVAAAAAASSSLTSSNR